jgi:hypothetical protein
VIVTVPTLPPKLFARPELLIVAEPVPFTCVQTTLLVRSCVELSVYVPVAVNCSVLPKGIVGLAGVTEIETSAGLVTDRTVLPLTLPEVAVMVTVPVDPPVVLTSPVPLIVADPETFVRLHVTEPVKSCEELSV